MNKEQRNNIIETISKREKLRPMTQGKRLLIDPFRVLPYYLLAALGHIRPFPLTFKTLWGTKMTCYLPEGNTFYYYGYCEANLANFLLRYLKEGSTFIDVGAHVGFYSMLTSKLVSEKGSVHSFEPTPWTFGLLRKNTSELNNVSLNCKAVSDRVETISFADYGPGYGAYNSGHPKGAAAFLNKKNNMIEVDTVVLDEYCRSLSLVPTFIKLDAEGCEHLILRGMNSLLSGTDRPLVSIEVAGGKEWEENTKRTIQALLNKGYNVYEMSIDGRISPHQIKDYYEYDNLLFIPTEKEIGLRNSFKAL